MAKSAYHCVSINIVFILMEKDDGFLTSCALRTTLYAFFRRLLKKQFCFYVKFGNYFITTTVWRAYYASQKP